MDYNAITRYPHEEGLTVGAVLKVFSPFVHRKIPSASRDEESALFPLSPASDRWDDPLVEVNHERIDSVPAYHMAGFKSAGPRTLVRESVLGMLGRIADGLPDNFGLTLLDGWRPLRLQMELFELSGDDVNYVAFPSDDLSFAPPHSTGGTVDVTFSYNHRPLALGTAFDDFSAAAHTDALENEDTPEKFLRRSLFWLMHSEGFVNFPNEWWHYEFGTRRWGFVNACAPLFSRVDEI